MRSIKNSVQRFFIINGLAVFACYTQAQTGGVPAQSLRSAAADNMAVMLQAVEETTPLSADSVTRASGYYSAQNPLWPPLPGNPNSLPLWPLGDGIYLLDDRNVDYVELQNQSAAMSAIMEASTVGDNGGGGVNSYDSNETGSGIKLDIETDDDNYTRVIYFNTSPGFIYNVEESTNLQTWSPLKSIIATDTNFTFSTAGTGIKFYRVVQPDGRISFPNWDDYVEAFAFFDVTTTIQGNYHLELYGDGNLLYQYTGPVPASGNFGVYDGSYDASQWPNVGDYAMDNWELSVTVTPSVVPQGSGTGSGPAQATVTKKQRHPLYPRKGITVEMDGIGNPAPGIQDDVDMFMLGYLQASANVCYPIFLSGVAIDLGTLQYNNVPKLIDTNTWGKLKNLVNDPSVTDWHYFGHGLRNGIGSNLGDPTMSISLAEFQNTNRQTHPFKYTAMDGCQTAAGKHFWQKPELLMAMCGYDSKLTLLEASATGKWPRFAWGWTVEKSIIVTGGTHLNTGHFTFLIDFYETLSHRNGSGFLDRTFDQAITFGQHPNGAGFDKDMTDNPDGYFLDYLGCGGARWDD